MGEPVAWAERRTQEEYERLRDACTRQELNKLLTSPEFGDWMRRQGRQRTRTLAWGTLLSVTTVLCACLLLGQDGIQARDAVVEQSITAASNQVPVGAPALQQLLTQHAAAQDSSSASQVQGGQQGADKQQHFEPPLQVETKPQQSLAAVGEQEQPVGEEPLPEVTGQQLELGEASQLAGEAQGLPESSQDSWPAQHTESEQVEQRQRLQQLAAEGSEPARDTGEREAASDGEPIMPPPQPTALEEVSTCPDQEEQQHVGVGAQQMDSGAALPSTPESERDASNAPSAPGGSWALYLGAPTASEHWTLQLSPPAALHHWTLHLGYLASRVPILGVLGAASLVVLILGTCGSRSIPMASPSEAPERLKEQLQGRLPLGAREKAKSLAGLEVQTEVQAAPEQQEMQAEQGPEVPVAAPEQIVQEQQQQLEGLAVKAHGIQARAHTGSPVPAAPATPSSPFTNSLLAPDARSAAALTPDILGDRGPRVSPAVRDAQSECGSKRLEQRRLEYEMATHGVEPQREEEPGQGHVEASEQPVQQRRQQQQQQLAGAEQAEQLQVDKPGRGVGQALQQQQPAAGRGQQTAADEPEQSAGQAAQQLPLDQAGQQGGQSPRQLPKQPAGSQDSPIRSWPLALRDSQQTEEGSEGGEAEQSQSDQPQPLAEEEEEEEELSAAAAAVARSHRSGRAAVQDKEGQKEEGVVKTVGEGLGEAATSLAPSSRCPSLGGTPSEEEASLLAGAASPETSAWVERNGKEEAGDSCGFAAATVAADALPPGSPWRGGGGSPWALQEEYEGGDSPAATGSALFPGSPWSEGAAAWEVGVRSMVPAELAQSSGTAWVEEALAPAPGEGPRGVWAAAERSRRWLSSCVPR